MSKVTSKLQITVPKAIADRYGIRPGDEITWTVSEDTIRLAPAKRKPRDSLTPAERLRLFDRATARQDERTKQTKQCPATEPRDRGWSRSELYERGRSG